MATNKTVLTKHARDMAQWPIYLTISNLSHKIWRLQVRSERIIIGLIPIHKSDQFNVKIEIYYQTIGVITKSKYNKRHSLAKFPGLRFKN